MAIAGVKAIHSAMSIDINTTIPLRFRIVPLRYPLRFRIFPLRDHHEITRLEIYPRPYHIDHPRVHTQINQFNKKSVLRRVDVGFW